MTEMLSHLDPDLVAADLATEPVHGVAAHRRAAAIGQSKPPVVQRADHLALLDPAQPQRAVGMRAAARERHELAAVAEDRDPQARGLPRDATAFLDLVQPTDRHPLRHRPGSPTPTDSTTKEIGNRTTYDLRPRYPSY